MTFPLPFSVVVCTRNRAQYLSICLESIARQDCGPAFEVLIVDNGSTDDTPAVIGDWCIKDARFRTVREPRVGLSSAKNTGVKLARGRLLLFTDDDVILDRAWARAYLEFFERRGEDSIVAGGPIAPIPHDLGNWPTWFDSCALADLGSLDYSEERPLGRYEYVWGANMAIPASHFGRFGLWDEKVGRRGDDRGTFEDTEYQDRVRAMGGITWFCPSAKLQHRFPRGDTAASKVFRTAFVRGRNQFWKEVLARKDEGGFSPRRDYFTCLRVLVGNLGSFAFWSLVFRFRRRRQVFVRAHAAARSAGWSMDLLRAGRETSRLSVAIGYASKFLLDCVLNLVLGGDQERG